MGGTASVEIENKLSIQDNLNDASDCWINIIIKRDSVERYETVN